MPILAMSAGTVTAVWGAAFVRLPDGKLKAIHVGDKMDGGEHILTGADGIVKISTGGGELVVKAPPGAEVDKTIASLDDPNQLEAPAAGLTGGAEGGFQPGLRVDRVALAVDQQEFTYHTERAPITPLFVGVVDHAPAPQVSISANNVVVNEAAGSATFVVTLDKSSAVPVTVHFNTVNGTATAGKDFTATSGDITFQPGETSKTISVPITQDSIYEGPETFNVLLSQPQNAAISHGVATVTIHDDGTGYVPPGVTPDDDRPAVGAVSSPTVAEGGNLDFHVTLTHPSTTPTPITLKLSDGTATLGTDTGAPQVSFDGGKTFVPITMNPDGSANITVPANTPVDQVVVRVPALTDNVVEPSETIHLTASTAQNVAPVEGLGTITDATNVPTLAISGPGDVNEAAGTITYTVTLSGSTSTTPVTVNYGTVDGTAKAGSDFGASSGTLTFAPGETTKTVTVAITQDNVYEGAETFKVQLTNPTGASITTDTATTTIHDDGTGYVPPGVTPDDDRPAVGAVSSPTVAEGGNLDFHVTLTHPSTTPTPITLKLSDGTATLGTDTGAPQVSFDGGKTFVPITMNPDGSANITVPANTPVDQVVVRVPALTDNVVEPSETIHLTASTAQNVAPVEGLGTITDATNVPTLAISGPGDVNEAAGTITYTVTLSGSTSTTPVTVNYGTVDGTAKAGSDFGASSGTLTFAPGETTKTVTVAITQDNVYEGAETFKVQLTNPTGASITTDTATTTIHDDGTGYVPPGVTPDDDRPAVGAVSSPTVAEGGNLDFHVTLTHPSTTPTPITLKLSDGTATLGTDTGAPQVSFDGGKTFVPITMNPDGSANITVPANTPVDQVVVRVPALTDNVVEPSETIHLTASTAQNVAPVEGLGTITDATNVPTLAISGPGDVNEAAGTITYTVTLSGSTSTTPVTVNYGTVDGTAKAGSDFGASSGTLTFAPGETTKTVTVAITQDNVYEGAETFKVQLTNPTGASITTDTATTTIHDDGTGYVPPGVTPDDDRPAVGAVSSPTVAEGGNLDFHVTLTHPSTTPTPITLKLSDGTATLGTDTGAPQVSFDGGKTFVPITMNPDGSANITVPANTPVDQVVVRVPALTDNVVEPSETIHLTASTAQNVAPVEGLGTITDATNVPTLAISGPGDVNEAAGTITYTVTLSGSTSTTPVTVNYGTVDGTAKAGSDFGASSGTLTFAPGETTKTVTVAITQDNVYEGAETFKVQLTNPTGASITTDTATTTIHDDGTGYVPPGVTPDDDRPAVGAVSSPTVAEGGNLDFHVTLTHPSTTPTPITLKLSDGTATLGTDTGAPQVSFDGGKTFVPITMNPDGSANITVPANTPVDQVVVRVPALTDNVVEPSETIHLTASTAQNVAPVEGLGTITDATPVPPQLDLDGDNSSGVSGTGYTTTFVEGGAGVRIADIDVKITDPDSAQLTGATVKLTNAQPGDVLALAEALPTGITASINGNVVTLSGKASVADYQTALHDIAFSNASHDPSTLSRNIEVTVTDGSNNSNVAVSTVVVTAVDDAPTVGNATGHVSEEGLPGGNKDVSGTVDNTNDSTTVSGQIAISDPDSPVLTVSLVAPSSPVYASNGDAVVWGSDGHGGLIGTAGSTTVATVTIDNTGHYTFTLDGALKHSGQGEDNLDINFGVKVNDGTATGTGNLTISVEDDTPSVPAPQTGTVTVQDTNLMVVLDISGSMNDPSGIAGLTRLQAAVQSIDKLLDKYDEFGNVAVRLVTFSGAAQTVGDTWLSVADAKNLIANVHATGGTNYDYAINQAETAFATTAGKIGGAQNVSYFFSDGNPTLSSANPTAGVHGQDGSSTQPLLGDGLDTAETAAWTQFLNDHHINSYAVGLGTGVTQEYLNPVAYNGQTAQDQNGVVVSDLNQLDGILSGSVSSSTSGHLLASGSVAGVSVGADGGHLSSIVINGKTYNYDAAHPDLSVTTSLGGQFTLNWVTGAYGYSAPHGLTASNKESFTYSVVDGDGDVANSSVTLNVVVANQGTTTITSTGPTATITEVSHAPAVDDPSCHDHESAGSLSTGIKDTTTTLHTSTDASCAPGSDVAHHVAPVTSTATTDTTNPIGSHDDGVAKSAPVFFSIDPVTHELPAAPSSVATDASSHTVPKEASALEPVGSTTSTTDSGSGITVSHGDVHALPVSAPEGSVDSSGQSCATAVGAPTHEVLSGSSAGTDVFAWHFADPASSTGAVGGATDTIKDFSVMPPSAGGDVLDLRDLLHGGTATVGAESLHNYLEFDTSTANTIIKISPSGGCGQTADATHPADAQHIVLENVNIRTGLGLDHNASDTQIITKLLDQGKLLVDHHG